MSPMYTAAGVHARFSSRPNFILRKMGVDPALADIIDGNFGSRAAHSCHALMLSTSDCDRAIKQAGCRYTGQDVSGALRKWATRGLRLRP